MGVLEIIIVGVLGLFVLSFVYGRRHAGCAGGSGVLKIVGAMAIVGGIAMFWSRGSDEVRSHQIVAEPGAAMHLEPGEFVEVSRRIENGFWQGPVRHTTRNRNWMFVLMGTVLIIGGALLFGRDRTRPVAFKAFTVLGIAAVLYIVVAFFSSSSHRGGPGRDTVVRLEPVTAIRQAPPERMTRPSRPQHAKRPKSRPDRPVAERVAEELPPRAGEIPVAAELAHDEVRAAAAPAAAASEAAAAPPAAPAPPVAEPPVAEPPVAEPPVAEPPAAAAPPPTEPAAQADAPTAAEPPATPSPVEAAAASQPASAQPPAAEAAPTPSAPASALAPETAPVSEPPAAVAPVSPAPESAKPDAVTPPQSQAAAPQAEPVKAIAVEKVKIPEPKIAEPTIQVPVHASRPLSVAVESTPPPEWIDAPARLVKSVYIVPVRSGLFASLPECQGQLNMQIKREADHYIDELLRDLGDHASALVDVSPEYLQRHVKKAEYSELRVSDSVGPMHQVHALLEFDDEARSLFRRRWHDAVVTDRLWFTGAGAALVLALLGTFYGYLRLDTQTGGAHKGKLQLAATLAALIAATAALMLRHSVLF